MKLNDFCVGLVACIILTQLAGCQDKDKDEKPSGRVTRLPDGSPMTAPDYDSLGDVKVGQVNLYMPIYFGTGVWPLRIYETFDFTVGTVLENGSTRSPILVRTRIENKACDPAKEAEAFIQEGLNLISQGIEVTARDWSSESEVFKGKSFYRTQHASESEIQSYHLAMLLANEKVPECITWNIEIKPDEPISSSFVEGSNEFIVLQKGFDKTWRGIGAIFRTE